VPVKRVLSGVALADAVSQGALKDPGSMRPFVELAASQPR
jgi:hypothetical protein